MAEPAKYDPLDRIHLGESVGDALLRQAAYPLGEVSRFKGAGIYALYFSGDFPAYKFISCKDGVDVHSIPIYVGKAVSPGARKGRFGLGDDPGFAVHKRIQDHRKSIDQTNNLRLSNFFCKFLILDDIWIPLGESLLIARFSPIWNTLVDGFGNHNPGKGRYEQLNSRWDHLHPGREFAEKLTQREETNEVIISEIEQFLRDRSGT